MPHKRPPLKQEHQKQVEPLALKAKTNNDAFFQKPPRTKSHHEILITATKKKAIYLLEQACYAIANSHPESANSNQSKALELAQKYIDSEIRGINYVQENLYRIKRILKTKNFTCDHPHDFSNAILLGKSFYTQNAQERVHSLICKAIQASNLQTREDLPGSGFEHMNPDKVWLDYIYLLLKLLPEKPYIITGTPISQTELVRTEPQNPVLAFGQFTLINPVDNSDIMVLADGQVIDLNAYQATHNTNLFNVRADADSEDIGSIVFNLSGAINHDQSENVTPYSLFGDQRGNFQGQPLVVGQYTLSATTWTGRNGKGTEGETLTIAFEVIDNIVLSNTRSIPPTSPETTIIRAGSSEAETQSDEESSPSEKKEGKKPNNRIRKFFKKIFKRKK